MGDVPHSWLWRIPVMVLCGSNRDYVEDSVVAGVMIASQKFLMHGHYVAMLFFIIQVTKRIAEY